MKFFNYIKKFLLFTLKEIYSFFLKLALLVFILFLFSVSIMTFFSSKFGKTEKAKAISKNYEYVLFNPSNITEDKIVGKGIFSKTKENVSFMDILNSLESIKENKNIKGIIIDLDNVKLSTSKTEELLKKFEQLKANGKKIYSFGSNIGNSNYPLASISNEIVMVPSASADFSLTGYHYSNLYYKDLLDKIGITMEVIRIGDFKSYGEEYTTNTISEGLKTELKRILDNRYNNFVNNIANFRKIDKNKLNTEILNGNNMSLSPFTARDKGLIDKLETFDEFTSRIGITEKNIVDIYDYYQKNQVLIDNIKKGNGTIAVIYAEGSIMDQDSQDNKILISPNNIAKKIDEALEINDLKGIVLRVNSGGGSALASEIIYRTLLDAKTKKKVPIYVSMSETAASGGYYISMAADKVFANKATITGSIGVVSMLPKFYNAQTKYGFQSNAITNGKFADTYDPFAPLSEETKNKIRESMNDVYVEFKGRVTQNRKITSETLENYAQGKIWLGDEAKNIKLVDEIATLEEVIKNLAHDVNLGNKYKVQNIYSKMNLDNIFSNLSVLVTEKFEIKSQLPVNNKILEEYKLIENNANKPMYYLPYKIETN